MLTFTEGLFAEGGDGCLERVQLGPHYNLDKFVNRINSI